MEKLTSRLPERDRARLPEEFFADEDAYWRMRDALVERYRGKWVAVHRGQVVAESDGVFKLLDRVKELGGHPYVACVGEEHRPFVVRRTFAYDLAYGPFALPRVNARFSAAHEVDGVAFEDVIPDTGADLSMLPESDGEALGLLSQPVFAAAVRSLGGPRMTALIYRVAVEIAGHRCDSLVQLTRDGERLLGRDVLNQLRITFDGPAGRVEVE